MAQSGPTLHIIAVDCCEHVLQALTSLGGLRLESLSARQPQLTQLVSQAAELDLLVLGLAQQTLSRGSLGHLRRLFPHVPVLVLQPAGEDQTQLRGEFLLAEQAHRRDCETVERLRQLFPLKTCAHLHEEPNHQTVRTALHLIEQDHANPQLTLAQLARDLAISPRRLSRLLNQQTGATFRQLLSQARVAAAQQLLRTRRFSVKEVAAQVGFADSHYFSRSFKQITGVNPSEYGRTGNGRVKGGARQLDPTQTGL
jgi:AraC-like DNA-binding protein